MPQACYHDIRLMPSFLYISVITLYHLVHSLCIPHVNLKPTMTLEALPSTNHIYLEYRSYKQSSKYLCNTILQQALLCVPIGQYRSCNPLFLISRRVCLVPPLHPLLNIALFFNHGLSKPYNLLVPLYIVFVYLSILQSQHNITLTLPYNLALTLPILILL